MRIAVSAPLFVLACVVSGFSQNPAEPLRPEWCRELPRPAYNKLTRINIRSDWFEIYRIRPDVYAIYEPHQFEEVISYLIVGERRALLFDTGLGVASIRAVIAQLTELPVTVLNSHTHFDHTGGNAEFSDILNEDTPFSRKGAEGQSNIYSRDALIPERICGHLPPESARTRTRFDRGPLAGAFTTGMISISEGAICRFSLPRVTRRIRYRCLIAKTDCCSREILSTRVRSTCLRPKPTSWPTPVQFPAWQSSRLS
jgi:Metallo-beta-lactamase superfamily